MKYGIRLPCVLALGVAVGCGGDDGGTVGGTGGSGDNSGGGGSNLDAGLADAAYALSMASCR